MLTVNTHALRTRCCAFCLRANNDSATRQGRNPLQVAGDGNASEGNPDMESRYKVRREFFKQDPRNRTLILHHPGEMFWYSFSLSVKGELWGIVCYGGIAGALGGCGEEEEGVIVEWYSTWMRCGAGIDHVCRPRDGRRER